MSENVNDQHLKEGLKQTLRDLRACTAYPVSNRR